MKEQQKRMNKNCSLIHSLSLYGGIKQQATGTTGRKSSVDVAKGAQKLVVSCRFWLIDDGFFFVSFLFLVSLQLFHRLAASLGD
jgi:hypothetical protein